MFLESFGGGAKVNGGAKKGRKELESQFDQLNELLKVKHSELESKEKQIQHLSKNIRKWSRKYHELESSISENICEEPATTATKHSEEAHQLRTMLLKLNRKNRELEQRLNELESAPKVDAVTSTTPSPSSTQEAPVIEEFEAPEFSITIQNQFKAYAEKCSSA